jgi:hypothetical protein
MNDVMRRRSAIEDSLGRHRDLPASTTKFEVETFSFQEFSQEAVESIAASLSTARMGAGACVIKDLEWSQRMANRAQQHLHRMRLVSEEFARHLSDQTNPKVTISSKTVRDGQVPLSMYGSRWTFKQLHSDSGSVLFGHLFGPMTGHLGGNVILADMRRFLSGRTEPFDELFEWDTEIPLGSKAIVRPGFADLAVLTCGVDLGRMQTDDWLLVNNAPQSGIFHAATEVVPTSENFQRVYHRCSTKLEKAD